MENQGLEALAALASGQQGESSDRPEHASSTHLPDPQVMQQQLQHQNNPQQIQQLLQQHNLTALLRPDLLNVAYLQMMMQQQQSSMQQQHSSMQQQATIQPTPATAASSTVPPTSSDISGTCLPARATCSINNNGDDPPRTHSQPVLDRHHGVDPDGRRTPTLHWVVLATGDVE